MIQKLKRAGFIISVKSELRPTKKLGFVGKLLDTLCKTITNQPAVLAGAFRMWLRGVGTGTMSGSNLLRLLGRIQWLARPGSFSCFLSGAYQAAYSGTGRFTRGLMRAIGTALLFSLFPSHTASHHQLVALPILQTQPHHVEPAHTLRWASWGQKGATALVSAPAGSRPCRRQSCMGGKNRRV